jgi:hypothetical protein
MAENEGVKSKNSTTCQFVKANHERCMRKIAEGRTYCWQHSHGLKAKWKSLTRNQSVLFSLAVIGVLATVSLGVIPLMKREHSQQSSPLQQSVSQPEPPKVESGPQQLAPNVGHSMPKPKSQKQHQSNSGGTNTQQSTQGSDSPAVGTLNQGPGSIVQFGHDNTATVNNFAPPERHLTAEQKKAIVDSLQGKTCKLWWVLALLNAPDAQQFASEIKDAFKDAGCEIPAIGVQPAVNPSGTWHGIEIDLNDGIQHGQNEPAVNLDYSKPYGIVIRALQAARLHLFLRSDKSLPQDGVGIAGGAP